MSINEDLKDAVMKVYRIQCQLPVCGIWRYLERVMTHIDNQRIRLLDEQFSKVMVKDEHDKEFIFSK